MQAPAGVYKYYSETVEPYVTKWQSESIDSIGATLWETDPLYVSFGDLQEAGVPIIYVAAAGNLGFKFPLAPALWDFVLSASAAGDVPAESDSCTTFYNTLGTANSTPFLSRADYSNYGEISLDGSYFASQDVAGTSFAAPKLSYLTAMYWLKTGQAGCGQFAPPFKYAPESLAWCNFDLDEAVPTLCPAFPTPNP
jgi:hypothetical protein